MENVSYTRSQDIRWSRTAKWISRALTLIFLTLVSDKLDFAGTAEIIALLLVGQASAWFACQERHADQDVIYAPEQVKE